jgi:hypothetical protein
MQPYDFAADGFSVWPRRPIRRPGADPRPPWRGIDLPSRLLANGSLEHIRLFTGPYHRQNDPELDPPREYESRAAADFARNHSRLVANPFLALLGWILACSVMFKALNARDPLLSLVALLGFMAAILLIQYHCLDCGKTGWAFRAGRHLCPLAAARALAADTPRWIGPGIFTQLKFWFVIAALAACSYLLKAAARS